MMQPDLTPEMVLRAYALGLFPMAESKWDTRVLWVDPCERGILPLETLHIPRSLAKTMRGMPYEIHMDRDFRSTIRACADSTPHRPDSWINTAILDVFTELAEMGYAHSVEVWEGVDLIGGLYGVAMGGVFFGESMFSRRRDASKIALVALVQHLAGRGFTLLDTQFVNPHLERFGAIEITRAEFLSRLEVALQLPVTFT